MTEALRLVLGDQLTRELASLRDIEPRRDVILLVEVAAETVYVRHHKQKIALIFSAMRHFAQELRAEGLAVDYVALDDPENTGDFTGELRRAIIRRKPRRLIVTQPGEWRVAEMMRGWETSLGLPVEIRDDDRFYCSQGRFAEWAQGRRSLRMEFFYRAMRRESGLLMAGDGPVGGQWNFDAANRKALPKSDHPPKRLRFTPDRITREVLALVARKFADHFGDLEDFGWPTTRGEALAALDHFIAEALPSFGDYQDAMKSGEPFLYHGLISTSLNLGLLTPREICLAAERAWLDGAAPLNAVEGLIRQILGWREYVRGIYWLKMPDYAETNFLEARRALPWFYWSGETDLNCIAQVVADTRRHAYAHHIQRLMVTGNFALLAGIEPREVEEWYLVVFADAYEWVELPNTHGMALFADGGLLGSKPYAASGAYIDRMSDYCGGCVYDPKKKSGAGACPFNLLYWNFLIENQDRLAANPRLAMPYRNLAAKSVKDRDVIRSEAQAFLISLETPSSGRQKPAVQLGLDLKPPFASGVGQVRK